jgi:predicted glycoside hydrolase/deacetylase ChbG (UPF0249 family)
MKYLSITADDYGAHPAIDKGIEDAIEAGAIDNVDCMVTIKNEKYNSVDAIRGLYHRFKDKIDRKELSLGLHISLTCGSPLCSDKDVQELLCKNGRFRPMQKHAFSKLNLDENQPTILKELNAQYAEFEKVGIKPDHVSCHTGMTQSTEKMIKTYFNFAIEEQMPVRNTQIISRLKTLGTSATANDNPYNEKTKFKKVGLNRAISILVLPPYGDLQGIPIMLDKPRNKKLLEDHKERGLKFTNFFIDNFYCNGNEQALSEIIKNLTDSTFEMVVHPISDQIDTKFWPIPKGIQTNVKKKRIAEWKTLIDKHGKVNELLTQHHGENWQRFRINSSFFES